MIRNVNNGVLIALSLLFVFINLSNGFENSIRDKPKSSYGPGFGDTSVHLPSDTIIIKHDTILRDDRFWFVIKNHNDSLKYWMQRCQLHLKETDSIFQIKIQKYHLTRNNVRDVKGLIDSLNNW
jgi:hypothetical protein